MVRIMIKGGVWKNTEDEILKAAVMKYGKNQWARISSLLVRKSAKQCKARWYEWLDPSIKKTEWTRDEEEKLLHLAKIMPTQWRTIAPMIGRTAAQCLEHYEKLLDAAQDRDPDAAPAADDKDDPRKLKPGEIDPLPEARAARPDPVDMDEDEKEMLSEARARLSNTRGKKAKRKAREKQLEEARRLAALQKRRELKAAGIELRQKKKKRKYGIDYNAEIPFERKPQAGFFDVSNEKQMTIALRKDTKHLVGKSLEQLEGKNRDEMEAEARKKDAKKQQLQKQVDPLKAIINSLKMNDPEPVRRRSKLSLPAPQISELELEEIAKGSANFVATLGGSGADTPATRALMGGITPAHTPMRTPRTPMVKDTLKLEAQNLIALTRSETPLRGGENAVLNRSDFSGVTPKRSSVATPNVLNTPTPARPGTGLGATPSHTPMRTPGSVAGTPIRDQLGINAANAADEALLNIGNSKKRAAAAKRAAADPKGLNLPEPANEYELVLPELPADTRDQKDDLEEDAEDAKQRVQNEESGRQSEVLRRRSQMLQRGLPRPAAVNVEMEQVDDADEMVRLGHKAIAEEMIQMLRYENAKYPEEQPKKRQKIPKLQQFTTDELQSAKGLVTSEFAGSTASAQLAAVMGDSSRFGEMWAELSLQLAYLPSLKRFGLLDTVALDGRIRALQQQFELVKEQLAQEALKAHRLETKVGVLTGGYQGRARRLAGSVDEAFANLHEGASELSCYRDLETQETKAIPHRLQLLKAEVAQAAEKERLLQERYVQLTAERDQLTAMLSQNLNAPMSDA
jgi:pre-mRNA-splicing factor CDC5/CEF1